ARDDGVELVQRQVDAVVRHAVLRKVVGADALAAVAGADQRPPGLGARLMHAMLLPFEHPAAQDAHRLVVILRLAAAVLALDLQLVRRALLVPDAHSAFGLVDVLAARAAGPHALPLDVGLLDLDRYLIGFRHDGDRRRRRVDAPLRLGLRDALDPMAARLV